MSQHPSRAGVAGTAPREAPAGVRDEPFQRPSRGSCGLPEAWRREVSEPHPHCSSNKRETSPRRTRRRAGAGTGGSSSQRARRSPASTSPGRVCPRGSAGRSEGGAAGPRSHGPWGHTERRRGPVTHHKFWRGSKPLISQPPPSQLLPAPIQPPSRSLRKDYPRGASAPGPTFPEVVGLV